MADDKARAITLMVKPRALFRPSDPMSVPLLRLLAATNDARHLQKLLIVERAKGRSTKTATNVLRNAELGYSFRMLCGHLFEAAKAFVGLDMPSYADKITRIVTRDQTGRDALAHVRKVYHDHSAKGFKKRVLNRVRTFGAFHYKDAIFEQSLKRYRGRVPLLVVEYTGLSRYAVTDRFLDRLVREAAGFSKRGVERDVREAIQLAGSVGLVVDRLVADVAGRRRGAVVGETREMIVVPRAVARARREVERQRHESSEGDAQKAKR